MFDLNLAMGQNKMTASIYKNNFTPSIKKVCVFCTYLHSENLPQYIIHYITALKKVGYETILVSHSNLLEKDLLRLDKICCTIILKENIGYDFFAWKYGIEIIGNFSQLEGLLLANDSIIGPFEDLSGIFQEMNSKYDFWGLTESHEHKYHIQSYFLHANNKILNNKHWVNFWNDLILYKDKLDIVKNYEIELTQTLKRSGGIKIGAWVNHSSLTAKYPPNKYVNYPRTNHWHGLSNPTVKHWRELLTDFDFPFIKKNLFFDKEHYDLVYSGHTFRYNVIPVNWKNIILNNYGPASVTLIEDFLVDIHESKSNNPNYRQASYKILFLYETITSSAQIDYLRRLIQFYNQRNIETELIVNSSPALPNLFNLRIRDITKVNILSEISKKETEILKYKLSQEYVGTVIIGDVASAALAQAFSYTNAPHILITDIVAVEKEMPVEYDYNLHSPLTVRPSVTGGQNELLLDPVNISVSPSSARSANEISLVTLVGLSDIKQQRKQVISFIQTLKEKGLTMSFRLLFNKDEYEELKMLIRTEPDFISFLQEDLNCSVNCYDDIETVFDPEREEIIVSYFNEGYLPDEYLQCYRQEKVLLLQANNDLHTIICGNEEHTLYEFFKVEQMAGRIQRLVQNKDVYQQALSEQRSAISNYILSTEKVDYDDLLFKKVIDFTELKAKEPIITVIFHFHFYSFDDVSFVNYKKRLRQFYKSNVNYLFSVTEDSYEIDKHVASLKEAFPGCTIKIVPNKGRDIGAKFLLFDYLIKTKRPFEYVVVLHDKKSLHLPFWEAKLWIDSLLKIIDPINYKPILRIFNENKKTGIVGTAERITDCIIKWSDEGGIKNPVFEWNNDLLHKMILKYNINIEDYNFVGGTMFWIKGDLLRSLNEEYSFIKQYQTLEEGNVMDNNGSTITHCWERLICWLSTNNGYTVSKLN